jgi:hypothetical protein
MQLCSFNRIAFAYSARIHKAVIQPLKDITKYNRAWSNTAHTSISLPLNRSRRFNPTLQCLWQVHEAQI